MEENDTISLEKNGHIESTVPILVDLMRRGIKESVVMEIDTEELPSVHTGTEYYRQTIKGKKRKNGETTNTGSVISKSFIGDEEVGFERPDIKKNTLQMEADLMREYEEKNANVPRLYPSRNNILIMEDLGKNSLEKRINGENEKERVRLTTLAIRELAYLHKMGREIQGEFFKKYNVAKNKANLEDRARRYFADLSSSREQIREGQTNYSNPAGWRKSFFPVFENTVLDNISGEDQLIHGDMTTYHLFFVQNGEGEEKIYTVDFGNPKFDLVCFDNAPIVFSQDTNIPIEKVEDVFIPYLEEKARLEGFKGSSRLLYKGEVSRNVKKILNVGIFENLRRSAKSKVLQNKFPEIYRGFIETHPTYEGCRSHYQKSTSEIIDFLRENSSRFELSDQEISGYENLGEQVSFLLNPDVDGVDYSQINGESND